MGPSSWTEGRHFQAWLSLELKQYHEPATHKNGKLGDALGLLQEHLCFSSSFDTMTDLSSQFRRISYATYIPS